MKIAIVAPIVLSIPPKKHGGIERVIHGLTENLVKQGHDVTLFATGNSETSAKLEYLFEKPVKALQMEDTEGTSVETMHHIGFAYKQQDRFDIIHDHTGYLSLPTAHIATTPVVMTMHMPFYKRKIAMFEALNNPYLVTISKAQAPTDNNLNIIGNVYNGLEMEHYPFSAKSGGYLLFVGTLQRKKGPHVAIKVAKRLGLPLILAAKLDPKHKAFFNEKIKPELGGNIRWIGEVTEEHRNKLMSKALALLSPVLWEEPFGLTLIEAMSTGCPVISYKRGSTSEIIKHGKTGFIVSSLQDMADIVAKIPKIDRMYCRDYSLANFSAQHMTQAYENIYKKVIEEQKFKNERMKKESTIIKRSTLILGMDEGN